MRRLWLFVSRFTVVALTLFPTWLAYVFPVLRLRRGLPIDEEKLERMHRRHAPRFRRLAMNMRGGLIKVGQILSTRVDILPAAWTGELSSLQDRVARLRELSPLWEMFKDGIDISTILWAAQ